MKTFLALVISFRFFSVVGAADIERTGDDWPQWRGPSGTGVALHADPPIYWDEQTNINWKIPIPGDGSSTPIVWGDRIFVTTAVKTDRIAEDAPEGDPRAMTKPSANYYQFVVLCLDRETGHIIWKRVAREATPHEGIHSTHSYAAASPTTDGKHVFASFGSQGIYCYDFEGEMLWQRDLGDMRTRYGWGEATSPVVHGDSLVINWDHEDQSFIEVLDATTGKTIWRADRDEPTSWATPLVVPHKERTQVVVNGTNRVRSYDLASGEVIWQCGGQTVNAIPTPIPADGMVVCMSGYRSGAIYAIPLDAIGDVTDSDKIIWRGNSGTPYVPSPLLLGDRIYFTKKNSAVLSCLDVATGKPVFDEQRLPGLGDLYASPAAAGGRIYFVDRSGTTLVIKDGDQLEVLSTNKLDDPIDASPVLVGNRILLRGRQSLYCIEAK